MPEEAVAEAMLKELKWMRHESQLKGADDEISTQNFSVKESAYEGRYEKAPSTQQ